MRRALAALALPLALTAYSPPPAAGVVTDKSWTPGYVTFFPCGKVQCQSYVPPAYYLTVRANTGSKDDQFSVKHKVWDSCTVGARWSWDSQSGQGRCS